MKIDGTKLIIYKDGEPIEVSNGCTIDVPSVFEETKYCGTLDFAGLNIVNTYTR